MNKFTITPENLSDMFCRACAAVVILEPMIKHYQKSSNAWTNIVIKYFWKDGIKNDAELKISKDADVVLGGVNRELSNMKAVYNTCEQLMRAIGSLPDGNIEISLDHAIEIVYYSKQYETMGNKKLCFGVL